VGSDENPKGTPEAEPIDEGHGPEGDERSPGGRRRVSPAVTAAVVVAVLLAGGGGAYLATSAGGGDGTTPPSSTSGPDKLALDGYTRPGTGASVSGGIASGEPNPNAPAFRVNGDLPDGPDRAAVHRASGGVSRADVAALAKALGVGGTPHRVKAQWVAGDSGGGPALWVDAGGSGAWNYRSTVGRPGCRPHDAGDFAADGTVQVHRGGKIVCMVLPGSTESAGGGGGSPVPADQAKRTAQRVLKAAGVGDARLEASQVMGATRMVTADPEVGGLPTSGWTTRVEVGPKGVVSGHGMLAELADGQKYPVVSAREALRMLESAQTARPLPCAPMRPMEPKSPGKYNGPMARPGAGRATGVPESARQSGPGAADGSVRSNAPCMRPQFKPAPQRITKAEFGLSAQTEQGRSLLVPSWLFTVDPAGTGGQPYVLTQVAVEPKFIAPPRQPVPPEPGKPAPGQRMGITSYAADGRTLTVTFWGGVCRTYSASADESADQVKVTVTGKEKKPGRMCPAMAKRFTEKVTLDKPLGGRAVVDGATGHKVTRSGT
jgi:hypothetical protein